MPSPSTLVAFCGASLLLLVVPGPAVLYIVTRSAAQGRRAGLVSVAGIHVGTLVHVAAAVAGLSAVVVASAAAFTAIKLAGALYLSWLGLQTLRGHRERPTGDGEGGRARPMRRLFRDGIVLNILNPKTALFFLAFVPQFVAADAGNATTQLLVLSGVFITLGLVSDGAYALAAGWAGELLARRGRRRRRAGLVSGSTYLGLGLATAVTAARS